MKLGATFKVVGVIFIVAALCLTGYNVIDAKRADKAAKEVLELLLPEIDPEPAIVPEPPSIIEKPDEVEYPDYVLNPHMDMPATKIKEVSYIGVIELPTIGIRLPVAEEWSYPILKKTPARYKGSVYLDDMIILAHNYDRHFGNLKSLSIGDTVKFTDMDGNVFNYKVFEIETLRSTAVEEMESGDWDLTLFTCTIGGVSRVTVRSEKVS